MVEWYTIYNENLMKTISKYVSAHAFKGSIPNS